MVFAYKPAPCTSLLSSPNLKTNIQYKADLFNLFRSGRRRIQNDVQPHDYEHETFQLGTRPVSLAHKLCSTVLRDLSLISLTRW